MRSASSRTGAWRPALTWAGIGGAHLALFALLAAAGASTTPPATQPVLTIASIREAAAPAAVMEPVLEPVEAVVPPPAVDVAAEPVAAPAGPAQTAGDGGCNVDALIREAFSVDGAARDALSKIPPQARSVANALQVWDRVWTVPASRGWRPIRRAIADAVMASPMACRTQEVTGPRMIAITDTGGTTMLVVGSGRWAWQDIVAKPQ